MATGVGLQVYNGTVVSQKAQLVQRGGDGISTLPSTLSFSLTLRPTPNGLMLVDVGDCIPPMLYRRVA